MNAPTIYSFEIISQRPRVGQVYHLLCSKFNVCDILSIGDIVITDQGHDIFKESDWDFIEQNKSFDSNNQYKINWHIDVFNKYWQYLKESDSLLVYFFDNNSKDKFRKFSDYAWFFCYHIWDNSIVELYTARKDVIPFINENYEVKIINFPGKIAGPGDIDKRYRS